MSFRYVKIGDVVPGDIDLTDPVTAYSQIDGHVDWGGANTRRYLDTPKTTVKVSACSTPDISVSLEQHSPAEFAAIGSRTNPVKFELAINNCPAGLGSVQYGFNVHSGTGYTANQGLFGLTADSTAKGIQVKLMRSDGTTTVELDKWYQLTDYNKATGGTYRVPLSAAYQRTGNVSSGSANAELIIAMSYN